jgi:hypothetical protein
MALGVRSSTECPASMDSGSFPVSTSTSSIPCAAYRRLTAAKWRITWCRRRACNSRNTTSPHFVVPAGFPLRPRDAGTLLRDLPLLFGPTADLTPDDLAFFGARVWQILTSCKERRLGEYERTSWWEFVGAEQRSASYQKFLATGITRSLVAAKARKASTRTIGDVFVQLVLTILDPSAGSTDRVLDGPTNLVWIDPWLVYLESSGVRYVKNAQVEEILCENGRMASSFASKGRAPWCMATTTWPRSRSRTLPPW